MTTVSKETEINRDNIYLSPREERERKEKTNLTKNIDFILTSSFLIIIFPCTSLKKNITKKKKKEKINKKEEIKGETSLEMYSPRRVAVD